MPLCELVPLAYEGPQGMAQGNPKSQRRIFHVVFLQCGFHDALSIIEHKYSTSLSNLKIHFPLGVVVVMPLAHVTTIGTQEIRLCFCLDTFRNYVLTLPCGDRNDA